MSDRHAQVAYLEILVGPYTVALPAHAVVTVRPDVVVEAELAVRGGNVPMVDLAHVFGGEMRHQVPFAVVFEAGRDSFAVGVDRVDHWGRRDVPALVKLPAFGLRYPELFLGGLRDDNERLLWVLKPEALASLVQQFDPAQRRTV